MLAIVAKDITQQNYLPSEGKSFSPSLTIFFAITELQFENLCAQILKNFWLLVRCRTLFCSSSFFVHSMFTYKFSWVSFLASFLMIDARNVFLFFQLY